MNLNVCEVMGRCVGGAASGLSIVAVIAALSTNVMAQSASRPQGATTSPNTMTSAAGSTAAAPTIDTANSTIGELQQLMQGQGISELRTTYNGNYGSSLLFKSDNRTYYVALFQQKNFWRVVKTTSEVQAEQTYKSFVGQTEKLAEVDIRRIKLEADKPESCSSILWRSWDKKELAAEQLKLTATDMLKFGLVDGIIPEPVGGAHWNYDQAAETVKNYIIPLIKELKAKTPEQRVNERIEKFGKMGFWEEN